MQTTLELFCKCFGWQGGTIHDAKKRFAIASMQEMDRFCSSIAANTQHITDIDQALWFMSHRRNASGLQVNAIAEPRPSAIQPDEYEFVALAKRKAERDAAAPVPEGRQEFTGTIVKAEWRDSEWGPSLKMLFRDDRGFRLWGSVPKQIEVPHDDDGPNGKGLRITFTGTPKRSDDDEKFGFVSRPSKAEVIE